jgi:hypothetical protein
MNIQIDQLHLNESGRHKFFLSKANCSQGRDVNDSSAAGRPGLSVHGINGIVGRGVEISGLACLYFVNCSQEQNILEPHASDFSEACV